MNVILRLVIGVAPVFFFLAALVAFDSYKLIRFRAVLTAVLFGAAAGFAGWAANTGLIRILELDLATYSKYIAPVVEELFKAGYVFQRIRSKKVGFMIDGAIVGFGVGAGFACVENTVALHLIQIQNPLVWAIRGFGTAMMHGGTTCLFGILARKSFEGRKETMLGYVPALLLAVAVHSIFNHFFLNPVVMTLLQLVVLPLFIALVFVRSERSLRAWLEEGMDSDVDLLESIMKGDVSQTKIGRYFHEIQDRFAPERMADMLCYMRVHLELAIRAKGALILKGAGFRVDMDEDIRKQFQELKYLEKNIGRTGKWALAPLLPMTSRDLWQIQFIQNQ